MTIKKELPTLSGLNFPSHKLPSSGSHIKLVYGIFHEFRKHALNGKAVRFQRCLFQTAFFVFVFVSQTNAAKVGFERRALKCPLSSFVPLTLNDFLLNMHKHQRRIHSYISGSGNQSPWASVVKLYGPISTYAWGK